MNPKYLLLSIGIITIFLNTSWGEQPLVLEAKSGKKLNAIIQFSSQSKVAFQRSDDPKVFHLLRDRLTEESNAAIDLWRQNPSTIEPGDKIELGVFNKERWAELGTEPVFFPWVGNKVVVFTLEDTHDPAVMGKYLHYLDQGWAIFEYVTGSYPKISEQSKLFDGKGIIRCPPSAKYLKAGGLGMVGRTDISLSYFYADFWKKTEFGDYHLVKATPDRLRGYCFYEMGRNFYLWDTRHNLFTTGFAVAMRHICMRELGLREPGDDADDFAQQKLDFHKVVAGNQRPLSGLFKSLGAEEDHVFTDSKGEELKDKGLVNFYASMILHGYTEHGGLEWVQHFYRSAFACPRTSRKEPNGVESQWLNFVVCFNLACKANMEETTRSSWRIPLTDSTWDALKNLNWSSELNAKEVFAKLPFASLPLATQLHDARFLSTADCPPNLVKEAGFETPSISEWRKGHYEHKTKEIDWRSMLSLDEEISKNAKHSYRISPSLPHKYQLTQDITVVPGQQYLLSGWIKTKNLINDGDGGGASLAFDWFPSTHSLKGTNEWTYLSEIVSTKKGVAPVRLRNSNVIGDSWFDDVSLRAIPDKYLE